MKRTAVKGRRISFAMTLWLLIVWVAVFASISWLTVLSGLLVAALIQVIFPLPTQKNLWHFRPRFVAILLARFIWDLIKAGVQVSAVVITGKNHDDAILKCDMRSNNQVYMTIVAAMTSMIPGTIVLEANRSKGFLYLHCLDIENQGGVDGIRKATRDQEKRVLLAFAPNKVLDEVGLRGELGIRAKISGLGETKSKGAK